MRSGRSAYGGLLAPCHGVQVPSEYARGSLPPSKHQGVEGCMASCTVQGAVLEEGIRLHAAV